MQIFTSESIVVGDHSEEKNYFGPFLRTNFREQGRGGEPEDNLTIVRSSVVQVLIEINSVNDFHTSQIAI